MQRSDAGFSLAEARAILGDLFVPKAWIYWTDFLLSWALGLSCFVMTSRAPRFSVQQVLLFLVSGLALYRAVLFIHELTHLRSGTFGAFRVAWNLLCGIPLLLPSFLYWTHLDHHRATLYGTPGDGEYLSLGRRPWRELAVYFAQVPLAPLLALARFLVLTPLGWFSPRLRRFIYRRCSSMVIDPRYVRPEPPPAHWRVIRLQETACFLWCVAALVVLPAVLGSWVLGIAAQVYLTAVFVLAVNAIRTLGAHRWTNTAGDPMTFVEQALDTLNFPRRPLVTELWGPVGLRFHALHHLFPGLPYHALPEAHRRLMERLPADSPYRQTERTSLLEALGELVRHVRSAL